jgi:hypothetical protein
VIDPARVVAWSVSPAPVADTLPFPRAEAAHNPVARSQQLPRRQLTMTRMVPLD